jgi:TolB protein
MALVSLAFGCSRRNEKEAARGRAAAAGGAPPAWELVYEREVGGAMDLFVIPAGGGVERRLTDSPAYDSLARWTPDGRSIVFTSDRAGKPQLWQVDADGRNLRRLRTNGATEYQADVSPDGKTLAFLSNLDGPERLMLQELATGATRDLVRHGESTIFGNPHWSPDGSRIVFSSDWPRGHQIYTVAVHTREVRPLSTTSPWGCEPRWSRDGRAVAFVLREHESETSQLVEQDLETGARRVLVDWPALNYDLAYSPDGREVAFASNITGEFAIYRQRLSDGRAWRLTFGGGPARYPDYRPRPDVRDP